MIDRTISNNGAWLHTRRGWLDVIRCLLGQHQAITSGARAGMWIDRCSCGATRVNRRSWFDGVPFTRRPAPKPEAVLTEEQWRHAEEGDAP